jgi:branched-chain amino acid transport system substrate-binding protein
MPHVRRGLGLAALAISVAALSACSSGTPTSSGTAAKLSNYHASAEYLGVSAGKADSSKSPVTLGWVNEQGGSSSSPEATAGALAAISVINDYIGGIDGHPLKLKTCFVASSEEQGQTCAQEMYNDPSVIGVLTGATGLSSPALHSTLAGKKPVLGSVPSSPTDVGASWAYYFGGGGYSAPASMAAYAVKDLDAKRIALIGPAFVGTTIAIAQVKALVKAAGGTLTVGTYPQGSSDVTSAIVASHASTANAVLVLDNTTTGCIAVSRALTQLAVQTKVISLNTCAEDPVKSALGDIPQWTFLEPLKVPSASVADRSGQVADFLSAMAAYQPSSTVQGSAGPSYALVMYAARLLDQVGASKATPTALNSAAAKATAPEFMGGMAMMFGTKPFPAIGSMSNLVYTYKGGGTWVIDANGGYVS